MTKIDQMVGLSVSHADGITTVTGPGAFGLPVACSYWKEGGAFGDPWRYRVTDGSVYSHPTEYGCQIMIRRHFIEKGIIAVPADNAHLDETDQIIVAETIEAREAITGKPRVGDFVRMPDGTMARCCSGSDYGMQTTKALQASYYASRCGSVSYSGGLDPAQLWEAFVDTGEVQKGRFWFFHHGQSGAGRGVDVYLPCRVYELRLITMTEDEARAHPRAKASAEFWGEGTRDHMATVGRLMNGRP